MLTLNEVNKQQPPPYGAPSTYNDCDLPVDSCYMPSHLSNNGCDLPADTPTHL